MLSVSTFMEHKSILNWFKMCNQHTTIYRRLTEPIQVYNYNIIYNTPIH